MAQPAFLILPAVHALCETDQLGLLALVGELRRVLKNQDWPRRRGEPVPRGLKVPLQDCVLIDSMIGEETVGGFGVRPILASSGNRLSHRISQLIKDLPKSLGQALVWKLAARELPVHPTPTKRH